MNIRKINRRMLFNSNILLFVRTRCNLYLFISSNAVRSSQNTIGSVLVRVPQELSGVRVLPVSIHEPRFAVAAAIPVLRRGDRARKGVCVRGVAADVVVALLLRGVPDVPVRAGQHPAGVPLQHAFFESGVAVHPCGAHVLAGRDDAVPRYALQVPGVVVDLFRGLIGLSVCDVFHARLLIPGIGQFFSQEILQPPAQGVEL